MRPVKWNLCTRPKWDLCTRPKWDLCTSADTCAPHSGLLSRSPRGYILCMNMNQKNNPNKVRESRVRRMAQRQGLALTKSRRRDVRATGFGTFMLIDEQTNAVVAS